MVCSASPLRSCSVTVATHIMRHATVIGRFGASFLGRPAGRGRGSIVGSETRSRPTLMLRVSAGGSYAVINASSMSTL